MQQFKSFPSTSGVVLVRNRHNQLLLAMTAVNIRERAKKVFREHQESDYGSYRAERQAVLQASQSIFVDYIETPVLSDKDRIALAKTIDKQSLSHNV